MTQERWQTIENLYHAAVERPPGQRARFLEEACAGDLGLLEEVMGLLSEERRAKSFMEYRAIDQLAVQFASENQSPGRPEPDLAGLRLSHYEVLEKIGSGGMGVVYKGRDTRLGRLVAIKALTATATADAGRVDRFIREARAASALSHPNIVGIYEIDQGGDTHFIAMEYVQGRTLKELIPAETGLPVEQTLDYAIQIAEALGCAHEAGIIHRDLKPSNILIDAHGRVKVLDFGLAKLTEPVRVDNVVGREGACDRTESGIILGTAAYMSPEQAEARAIDPRSDVFSFGAVLYEMATGRRAFAGSSPASSIAEILTREPPAASELRPEIPLELDRIIQACLRKDPAERPEDLNDARLMLEQVRDGIRTSGTIRPSARPTSRFSRTIVALLAGSCLLSLIGFFYFSPRRPSLTPSTNVIPLATLPGGAGSPSLSPDGRYLAFSWVGDAANNRDIYVMDTDNPAAMLRVTTDSAADMCPSWSPDGTLIAFCRGAGRKGSVFLVSPLGGPERRLTHYDYACISWMPDSRSIAVAQREREDDEPSIFLVSVADGSKRQLFHPPSVPSWNYVCWFSISPDGSLLAFRTRGNADRLPVSVLPLRNGYAMGEPRQLHETDERILGGAWMSDGRYFVFPSDRGGRRALWRIRADKDRENPQRLAGTDDADSASICAGPHQRLAYTRYLADTDIWSLRIDKDGRVRQPPAPVTRRKSQEHAGQFSPDGSKIAFESDYGMAFGTFRAQLWTANADGSNPIRVSGPGGGTPRWAPDSRQLAFNYVTDGNIDIWVMNADGSGLRRLTTEPSVDSRASWSRDGRWIYFRSNRSGKERIWKIPAEGGAARQLTEIDAQEGFEGSDGRFYFFRNTETRSSGNALAGSLWSVQTGGGQAEMVLPRVWTLAWTMSKRGVFFLDFDGPGWAAGTVRLKLFDVETRRINDVAVLKGEIRSEPSLSVTDDGSLVAWTQVGEQRSDLVLVENPR